MAPMGRDSRVIGDAIAVFCQRWCEPFDDVGRDVVQYTFGQGPGLDEYLEVGDCHAPIRKVLAATAGEKSVEALDEGREWALDEVLTCLFQFVALQPECVADGVTQVLDGIHRLVAVEGMQVIGGVETHKLADVASEGG